MGMVDNSVKTKACNSMDVNSLHTYSDWFLDKVKKGIVYNAKQQQ